MAADYFAGYLLGDYRGSQVVIAMFADDDNVPPVVYTEARKRVAKIAETRKKSPGLPPIQLDPRLIKDDVIGANEPYY